MKKLIIALALLFFATPAIADNAEFFWTSSTGPIDYLVVSHKAITDPTLTAQEFYASGGFTDVTLGNTSPQAFVIDYPASTQIGMFVTVFGTDGSSTVVMDAGSPTIYRVTTAGPTVDAHWIDIPSAVDGETQLIQINITVER